jgi:hypothetical protein
MTITKDDTPNVNVEQTPESRGERRQARGVVDSWRVTVNLGAKRVKLG